MSTAAPGSASATFLEVETSLNGAHFQGFAASAFLVPVSPAARAHSAPPSVALAAAAIPAVIAPTSTPGRTKRTTPATTLSLDEPNPPGRHGTTPEALRAELNAIVDYLAVDKASHARYQPRDDLPSRFDALHVKFVELEKRLKLLESEVRGQIDLSQFAKPEVLADLMKNDNDK